MQLVASADLGSREKTRDVRHGVADAHEIHEYECIFTFVMKPSSWDFPMLEFAIASLDVLEVDHHEIMKIEDIDTFFRRVRVSLLTYKINSKSTTKKNTTE